MRKPTALTVHLDEDCMAALEQLKRQIDVNAPEGMPPFSMPALARHAIRKWCDHAAAPVPYRHEIQCKRED
jgi:hypothetical protein